MQTVDITEFVLVDQLTWIWLYENFLYYLASWKRR